jgi:hypothetical protein
MSAPWNGTNDNPYDATSQSYVPETPSLDQLIKNGVREALLNLHTWLPAVVTQVMGNQQVSIQPLLLRRYVANPGTPSTTAGLTANLPVIQNVMVCMPRGQNYSIKLPVAVGDTGIALFCERSLDNWSASTSAGLTDPADVRHHDLADPIFIPGLVPFPMQTTDETSDLIVKNGDAELHVQEAGTFLIKNQSNELLSILSNLAEQCSLIANISGPTFNAAAFTAIQGQIDTLKGS